MTKLGKADPASPSIGTRQLSPDQAIELIKRQIAEAMRLLENRPLSGSDYKAWKLVTTDLVEKAFGANSETFKEIVQGGRVRSYPVDASEDWWEKNRRERLTTQMFQLQGLIEVLVVDQEPAANPSSHGSLPWTEESLWLHLHPKVVELARPRFEARHFADAVESALKEINAATKSRVKKLTGKEYDGAKLMHKAFSFEEHEQPILRLDDLSSQSVQDAQRGYMQIFQGAMIGIRNPKTHENVTIDENRAVHLLFLASLLMYKLDQADSSRSL